MTGHDPADNDEALSRSLDVLMPRPGGGVVEALSAELAAARLCASLCDEPLELRIADRYRLLEELGAGGMGVVYRAHDVTLERDVAIKLLQSLPGRDGTRDPARRDRLLEEARTLAKLRDPHVVPVFEVGTHRGEVFMVMELVEGLELGAWVEATKPKVKEILAAYVQAGRGLAAAHELDIIHRDFKPANARRDPKGHVRVLDFGLAAQDQGSSVRACVSAGSSDVASALTRALVGTPRYMAPEQREGRGVSAASDQYSFCVALHEALTGAPPSTERADASALAGRLPRWLQRVLQRGLQPDPALRYPSMRALLDELARDRGAGAGAYVGALVLALASAYPIVSALTPDAYERCVAASADAWDVADGSRARVRETFAHAAEPYARDTLARVDASLDAYIEDWRAGYRRACAATHRANTQSPALLDRRLACLERRRAGVRLVLDRLAGASDDATLRRRAAAAVAALPGVSSCDDAGRLAALSPPTPDQRAATDELAEQLARLEVDTLLGGEQPAEVSVEDLLARADEIVVNAEATGYAPTLVRALLARGRLHRFAGHGREASADLVAAELRAEAAGDDDAVIAALHEGARVELLIRRAAAPGEQLLARAQAKLERVGERGLARAVHRDLEGHVAYLDRRYADAIVAHRDALRRYAELPAAETRVGRQRALVNLGRALSDAGRSREALEAYERSYAIAEDIAGAGHPALTDTRYNHAVELLGVGALEQALTLIRWVRDEEARVLGERSLAVGSDEHLIATVLLQQGDLRGALHHAERELSVALEHPDATPKVRALALDLVGALKTELEEFASAREHLERARDELSAPERDPALASTVERHLGELALAQREPERALEHYARASEVLRTAGVPRGPTEAALAYERGRVFTALERPREAAVELETALEIWAEHPDNPTGQAEAKALLAEALGQLGEALPRACELAREAMDYLGAELGVDNERRRELEAWCGEHCQPEAAAASEEP